MDINNIFNVFSGDYKIDPKTEKIADNLLERFPVLKLVAFERLISQHEVYKTVLQNQFASINTKPEKLKEVMDGGDYMFFNRGWNLLSKLKLDDKSLIEGISFKKGEDPNFEKSIIKWVDYVIDYFVKIEEYEKCSHLNDLKVLIYDTKKEEIQESS